MVNSKTLRRRFLIELWRGLGIVWPILGGLLGVMAVLGLAVALLEKWPLSDGIYFAFVTGLTIGYGDLVPKLPLTRVLAVSIGVNGILITGLIAAISVMALQRSLGGPRDA